jgi:hypothetical protein
LLLIIALSHLHLHLRPPLLPSLFHYYLHSASAALIALTEALSRSFAFFKYTPDLNTASLLGRTWAKTSFHSLHHQISNP